MGCASVLILQLAQLLGIFRTLTSASLNFLMSSPKTLAYIFKMYIHNHDLNLFTAATD